jgi:K+-sensing histidine kinase KdpD
MPDHNQKVRWLKYVAAAITVGPIVVALRLASVSYAGVAAPLLLLDVVVVARLWGTGPALVAAASGAGAYSYFFLPPAGFGIEDPQDWIEFFTFIGTAVIAGELASRAERRTAEAEAGRREIERLYQELHSAFERASEAEAARRNEQLKAALLDALTHNLRTPLTSIKADGRLELLEVIDEESDRLNRFIGGLAGPDRIEPERPIESRAVDVERVIRTGLQRAETVTRDHRIVVAIDEGLPAVSVDAASITEAIYILLDNASKYAPVGTTITVAASRGDDREVRITVVDEGPGIPADLRERVFEKFFRVPARESHDPHRGGVGLGLPIARRLIEAQAGRIWIAAPASGRGTTVTITLAAAAGPVEAEQPIPVALSTGYQ